MRVGQDSTGPVVPVGPRGPGGRDLPPVVLAALRQAFADELAQRLPRLLAVRPDSAPDVAAQALRDAHTLGSSAVVVGELSAARLARAIEADLQAGRIGFVPARVDELAALLARWSG